MHSHFESVTQQLIGPAIRNLPTPLLWFIRNALHLGQLDSLYTEARSHATGRDPTDAVLEALEVKYSVVDSDLAKIPETGPVVVVSNHPFGMLDGLVLDAVLRRRRPDVKLLANSLLCGIPEMQSRFVPIDVFGL